jgi:hypothetical protein
LFTMLHGISKKSGLRTSEICRARETTYFRDHSRAVASYRGRSVLYKCAMSGTSGSSGFGSVNIEQIDSSTVESHRKKVEHISDQLSNNWKRNNKLTLGDCECWRPLVPQNVKADRPVSIDVGMIDLGGEADFRRLERIVRRESD